MTSINRNIQIGICQWCTDRTGPEALLRASEFGIDAIQIQCYPPGNPNYIGKSSILKQYYDARQKTSVEILSIGITTFAFIDIFKCNKKFVWKTLIDSIDAANELGIDLVWLPNFEQSEIRNKHEMESFVQLMHRLFEHQYKNNMNIKLGTENTLSYSDNMLLMSKINNKDFQVVLDVFTPVIFGYDPEEYFMSLWKHKCNQIHVKDGSGGKTDSERLNHGKGNTNKVIKYLFSLGFDGYLILENNYLAGMGNNVRYDIRQLERLLDQNEH